MNGIKPDPDTPFTVGMDGGYIYAREGSKRKAGWFEAIVGKSLHETLPAKRFGFVWKYDDKPKSRLNTMLQKQGFQLNQDIVFLSDGGDTVRDLQQYIAPHSEHLLDWFHITMRITVMKQMVSGLADNSVNQLHKQLENIKWNIWHGNVSRALDKIDSFYEDLYDEEPDKDSKRYKIWKYNAIMKIGYARVSSNNQDLELQKEELLKSGCKKIYSESVSGKDNNRTELIAIIESLRQGDIVVV